MRRGNLFVSESSCDGCRCVVLDACVGKWWWTPCPPDSPAPVQGTASPVEQGGCLANCGASGVGWWVVVELACCLALNWRRGPKKDRAALTFSVPFFSSV